jgi:serine/threonine protein kinase
MNEQGSSTAGQKAASLCIEEGGHYFLEPKDELPFDLIRNLGQGGCANVEEVRDRNTGAVYARKVFKIAGTHAERKHMFDNEVKVIQRLAHHHHIIRVFATYVARREVGLILTPVADRGSLDMFLQDAKDGLLTPLDFQTLYRSFGCLASGLHFMHTQKVRHKDIKPHNILVHEGSFIYTDFGTSLDYSAGTRSVTTGPPNSITRRYAAPELHDHSPRSSKTDVFSLGCVYFEIVCALGVCSLPNDMIPYGKHVDEVREILNAVKSGSDTWLELVINVTCLMLDPDPQSRPSVESIVSRLWKYGSIWFCWQCIISLPTQDTAMFSLPLPSDLWLTTSSNWSGMPATDVAFPPYINPTLPTNTKLQCSYCGEVSTCASDHRYVAIAVIWNVY